MKKKLLIFLVPFLILIVGFIDPYASRIRPFTAVPGTCAENSVGYSMSLHGLYICTNTGYKLVDIGGSTTFAPIGSKYIVQTPDANLTNEQALSLLGTGIVKNTTATGVLSIAAASDLPSGISYAQLTLTGSILNADLAGSIAYSKLSLTNSIVSGDIVSLVWSKITSTPTTIAGYGITDFNSLGDARWSLLGHTHTFASLTSIPTTFSGYGISDTSTNLATAISDELGSGKLIFSAGTLNITAGKTLNISNTITLTAIDGSTLAIGAGGTLGTNAFLSTAFAPLASPTFTGTVGLPTGITINGNTITFPTTTATIARTDSGQTFTGNQIITGYLKPSGAFNVGGIQLQANGGTYSTVLGADNGGATDTIMIGDILNNFSTVDFYAGGLVVESINSGTGTTTFSKIIISGGTPSITGNATLNSGSKDSAGKITSTGTGASTAVITFSATLPHAPACVVTNETTANLVRPISTTTTLTISATVVNGDSLSYVCTVY